MGNTLQESCLENPPGQRSLVGYSPGGRNESDTSQQLSTAQQHTHTAADTDTDTDASQMQTETMHCFARCPNPREKASRTVQLSKKGKFITDSNQGSCRTSNTVVRGQRALSRGGYPNL